MGLAVCFASLRKGNLFFHVPLQIVDGVFAAEYYRPVGGVQVKMVGPFSFLPAAVAD